MNKKTIALGSSWTLEDLRLLSLSTASLVFPEAVRAQVDAARQVVDGIAKSSVPVYGINTGFGALAETRVDASKLSELQLN